MIHGKQIRMKRLFPFNRAVFLALDHGFSMGPIKGIESIGNVIKEISTTSVDAFIVNYGAFKNLDSESLLNCKIPFILHLSGSGSGEKSKNKSIIYKGIDALKMGADAVSVQLNLGTENELVQIEQAAKLISECDSLGLPVLMMMYHKGEHNEDDIKSMVRMAVELGADMVKIDTNGNDSLVEEIVKNTCIPILLAGGNVEENKVSFLNKINGYLNSGARGVSVGRNIFASHAPVKLMNDVCEKVHHAD